MTGVERHRDGLLAQNVARSENTPHDRLTAIADHMLGPLEVEPDVRAIVLLETRDTDGIGHSGVVMHRYGADEEAEAILSLLRQAEAILATHGRTLRDALELLGAA